MDIHDSVIIPKSSVWENVGTGQERLRVYAGDIYSPESAYRLLEERFSPFKVEGRVVRIGDTVICDGEECTVTGLSIDQDIGIYFLVIREEESQKMTKFAAPRDLSWPKPHNATQPKVNPFNGCEEFSIPAPPKYPTFAKDEKVPIEPEYESTDVWLKKVKVWDWGVYIGSTRSYLPEILIDKTEEEAKEYAESLGGNAFRIKGTKRTMTRVKGG